MGRTGGCSTCATPTCPSGRALDRLLASEAADVAERLGFADTDSLHRDVSLAARRIGHAVDLTVRAARQVIPQRRVLSFARRERAPVYSQEAHGLIVHQGEVALDRRTRPATPLLGLYAGALAATRGLVLSPVTAENLGRYAPPIEEPAGRGSGRFLKMLAPERTCFRWRRLIWPAASRAGSRAGRRSGRGRNTTPSNDTLLIGTPFRRWPRLSAT